MIDPTQNPKPFPIALAVGLGCGGLALIAALCLVVGLLLGRRPAPPPAAVVAVAAPPAPAPPPVATAPASPPPAAPNPIPMPPDTTAPAASQAAGSHGPGTGGPEPVIGSFDDQTTLKGLAGSGSLTVSVNGSKAGDFYETAQSLDISKMVRPGGNTLQIVWNGPIEYGNVWVAYARTKNDFGTISETHILGGDAKRPGRLTKHFNIP